MSRAFSVTYQIVTIESAEHGETADAGFISCDVSLREAVADVFETRTSLCDGVECVDAGGFNCITVYNGMEFETGARESRTLHFPENTTEASKRRISRLMGAAQ